MVKKKSKIGEIMVLGIVVLFMVLGSIVLPVMGRGNTSQVSSPAEGSLRSAGEWYIVNNTNDLTWLSNRWDFAQKVKVSPLAAISGTLSNFTQTLLMGEFIIESSTHSINITMSNVNITVRLEIRGIAIVNLMDCVLKRLFFYNSPTVTMTNVRILLASAFNFGTLTGQVMGTPTLEIEKLELDLPTWPIRMAASGGSCQWRQSELPTGLTLTGFDTVKMTGVNVTGACNATQNAAVELDGCRFEDRLEVSGGGTVNMTDVVVTGSSTLTENEEVVVEGSEFKGAGVLTETQIVALAGCQFKGKLDVGLVGAEEVEMSGCTVAGRMTIGAGQLLVELSDSTLNELYVYSESNITLQNMAVTTLVEQIDPMLTVAETAFTIPYTFLFQPSAEVELSWGGYDNIQGGGYEVNYSVEIYEGAVLVDTKEFNHTITSYKLTVETDSTYKIRLICRDAQGNVASEEINIIPDPNLLPFILMIVGIAGAVIGVILVLYWRKQRQWQKTTLMEMPVG